MELIIRKFSTSRVALTWFRMFGAMLWNLLIIESFFIEFKKKSKIENHIQIWGVFDIVGKPSPSLI
jgi:hypothetical protein